MRHHPLQVLGSLTLATLALAQAARAQPPSVPSGVGQPLGQRQPVQKPDLPLDPADIVVDPDRILSGLNNWDFEQGLLGWVAGGTAFQEQPVQGDVILAARVRRVPLGGDYWNVPYPIGHHGEAWIGTAEDGQGDGATGTLTSKVFRLGPAQRFVSFLIGGDDGPDLRVELQARLPAQGAVDPAEVLCRTLPQACPPRTARRDGEFTVVRVATGRRSEVLRREVWDLASAPGLPEGTPARLKIVDQSRDGHLNVDDFRFSAVDPRPELLTVASGGAGPEYRDPFAPLWGFADLHAHPMAHLGFGGTLFFGQPDGPMASALSRDGDAAAHGEGGLGFCPLGGCVGNTFVSAFEDGTGHLNGGYPFFDGWPRFTSRIHQQMYVDWVRRAYQGGQRLMVALAVHNEQLASEFGNRPPFDDMTVYTRQVQAMRAFVERHRDFMEVALSPADARRIIQANKLAVVLGIEADFFGNCKREADCSDGQVTAELQRVRDLGVRYVFPVHVANNAFGGAAVYNERFNLFNRFARGDYLQVEDASRSGTEYRFGADADPVLSWYAAHLPVVANCGYYCPPDYSRIPGGHANVLGLTSRGRHLISELMRLGMLIDVDHLSQRATDELLALARERRPGTGPYPLSSGHTGFRDLAWRGAETASNSKRPSETLKRRDQVAALASLGGMVAPITEQGDIRPFGSAGPGDCARSSRSWASAYAYAVEASGGRAVGLGSDFNGLAGQPGPRFGTYACPGLEGDERRQGLRPAQVSAQSGGVRYATPISDTRPYRFEGSAYEGLDRDIWRAVAMWASGVRPTDPLDRTKNIARGFFAGSDDGELRCPEYVFAGNCPHERRAAFLVKTGRAPNSTDDPEVRRLHAQILPIWQRWQAMEGANPPLTRSAAGMRDFDINLDGLAHYGMLPDFLQDVKNGGADLRPLFRSAEGFVRMWEQAERVR